MYPWIQANQRPDGYVDVRCTVCRVQGTLTPQDANAFIRQHSAHQSPAPQHYGLGDVVAGVTKAFGIKPCTPCQARQQALNAAVPRVWRR